MSIPLAAGPRRTVISTPSWRQWFRRMSDLPGVTQSPSSAHQREHPFWLPHSVAKGPHRPLVPAIDGKWMADDQLVKKWIESLKRGKPRVISNFSGFLEEQHWFQHSESDPHGGTFITPIPHQNKAKTLQRPSFAALRDSILAQALGSGGNDKPLGPDQGFDKIMVKFSMGRCNFDPTNLEGNARQPPLQRFRKWIQKADHYRSYQFENTVDALLEASRHNEHLWQPFEAPLAFLRAVLQYNQEIRGQAQVPITRLSGLVVLREQMTEEFPYPRAFQQLGGVEHEPRACSIRLGIQPMRSDLYRHQRTIVVGQLAGLSTVVLIPPALRSLGGRPLEAHEELRKHFPIRRGAHLPRHIKIWPKKIWTRELEMTITNRVYARLRPGDILFVPPGWTYGVRNMKLGEALHSTVTWFLKPSDDAKDTLQSVFARARARGRHKEEDM